MAETHNDPSSAPGHWSELGGQDTERSEMGRCAAVVYALLAHRLAAFYDHGYWMTQAQGASLCAEWLMRTRLVMPMAQRKHLSEISEQVAAQIKASLSREAGLFTAHELMESLDPRYVSEIGASIMEECVRALKDAAP